MQVETLICEECERIVTIDYNVRECPGCGRYHPLTGCNKPDGPTYLVWWLDQENCEKVADLIDEEKDELPPYLKDQFDSRYGRPGRCRLWVDTSLKGHFSIDPWPTHELAKQLEAASVGGIVFDKKDLACVQKLPGIITNMRLELLTPA